MMIAFKRLAALLVFAIAASWSVAPSYAQPDIGNPQLSQSGTGAMLGISRDKPQEFVSVMVYGAKGDGVTADAPAIQKALDATLNVYFPAGTYSVSGSLTLRQGHKLVGAGMMSVTLRQDSKVTPSAGILYANSGKANSKLTGISVSDITLDGRVAVAGFDEHQHLASFNGVDGLTIERVRFLGYRGDGLYLGSGINGGEERHNTNIIIRESLFDGVNKDNRNGISIIDGDGVSIEKNVFVNSTRKDMPGPIDVEPDAHIFHVVRNISIAGNSFSNTGGTAGNICFYLISATFSTPPKNFSVLNNKLSDSTSNGIFVAINSTVYSDPMNLQIIGNTGVTNRAFHMRGNVNGFSIIGNDFKNKLPSLLGEKDSDNARNGVVSRNNLTGNGSSSAIQTMSGSNLTFSNNAFSGYANSALQMGSANSTLNNVAVIGNSFTAITGTGYSVYNAGGVDSASAVYQGNTGGQTHHFP